MTSVMQSATAPVDAVHISEQSTELGRATIAVRDEVRPAKLPKIVSDAVGTTVLGELTSNTSSRPTAEVVGADSENITSSQHNLNAWNDSVVTKAPTEADTMRALFESIDADESGLLDKGEIKTLVKQMGDRMSAAQLSAAMLRMDPERTGGVTFDAFAKWWKYKTQEYRRDVRKKVAEIFALVDEDHSGILDKQEVGLMSKKIAKTFKTLEFDPPFDLDRDFSDMDADGEGSITYDEFEKWFKERTGDDEPDVPVLPEYMVGKIHTLTANPNRPSSAEAGSKNSAARSGTELWGFLRPRLKTLVFLQKQWGSLHDIYGVQKGGTMFEEAPIPKKIRDPDSSFSGWWDLCQVIFLMYVAYAVPIRVGFSVDVETGSIWFLIGVVIDIYFIVDLFMNFRTAYWKENGMLEVDPRAITINYLKTWFAIDLLSWWAPGAVKRP
jgi:Ca2+-binding EF-hand superfamily protein